MSVYVCCILCYLLVMCICNNKIYNNTNTNNNNNNNNNVDLIKKERIIRNYSKPLYIAIPKMSQLKIWQIKGFYHRNQTWSGDFTE